MTINVLHVKSYGTSSIPYQVATIPAMRNVHTVERIK